MEHFLSSLLLACSTNVDNLAVGIAYGVKKLRISLLANLLIALVSAGGTTISMSVGEVVSRFIPGVIANALGSGSLIIIGVWGIWETLKTQRKLNRNKDKSSDDLSYTTYLDDPLRVDVDKSRSVELREAGALALALTINNLAGGIGAGISGLNIVLTTALTFGASLLAIRGGYFLGKTFTLRFTGNWSGIVSGVLIIALGLYEYFRF